MIVSRNWLAEYVDLSMPVEELTERLTLAGLNLESVTAVGDDTAIDVEVTSNRPDCLGHIGVAREIAVLYGLELRRPEPAPQPRGPQAATATAVSVLCPDLCPRYTARLIRGVKIGPSPAWLADRLRTLGIAVINNVVDITNYVLMEIGQPLHAFDFAKLQGGKLQVRRAAAGEPFVAIDHKTYKLSGDEVVIADAARPVALGGVMGGLDTEVTESTRDVLIEAADFAPLAVRAAARRHALHSPSSYRFERGVDPLGIDWASRRCCELILEIAGGELCEGVIEVGAPAGQRAEVKLRYAQVPRILGTEVPADEVRRILTALGCQQTHTCDVCVKTVPPSWRADLTREIDLIEEVARIHGYDKIPEDARVPVCVSSRTPQDILLERVRTLLTATGYDEAYTLSAVEPEWIEAFRPWTQAPPLGTRTPVLRRADRLRQSVVPSLLACRRTNEALSNERIEQFEIAKVYLPRTSDLPEEKRVVALASSGGFRAVKGVIEAMLAALAPGERFEFQPTEHALLQTGRSAEVWLQPSTPPQADRRPVKIGLLGEVSRGGLSRFELRRAATIAEIDLGPLLERGVRVPTAEPIPSFQPLSRDLNMVLDLGARWGDVQRIVAREGGPSLEAVTFVDDSYRDAKQIGTGKKSVLFTLRLRKPDGTLTSEEADAVRDRIVSAIANELGGALRA